MTNWNSFVGLVTGTLTVTFYNTSTQTSLPVLNTLKIEVYFSNKAACGDGILQTAANNCLNAGGSVQNEQCDDGNSINGDGCSSTCQVETNWACSLNS